MAVDTEDLINSAIDARAARDAQRRQIDQRAQQITRQLSSMSGSRRNRGQMESLRAELGNLHDARVNLNAQDKADLSQAQLRTHASLQNAHNTTQLARLARDQQVADEVTAVQNGLLNLESKYPNRSHDAQQAAAFHSEVNSLRDRYKMAFQNKGLAQDVFKATQFHDTERDRAVNTLGKELFKQTRMSPEQFISGLSTARASNVPLKNPDGTIPTKDQIEKARADNGQSVAMEVNGVTKLFDRTFFDNLKATFGNQPAPQAVTIAPEQPSIQPIVPTYGGQGAAPPGALVRNPDGSISPIVPTYGGEGAAPPGALVRTGVANIGTPPPTGVPVEQQMSSSTATLPKGIEPNQPIQPITQFEPGPAQTTAAPQVAAQPTVDPRMALAQKALDDPNATEAHKAAARQILGIQ